MSDEEQKTKDTVDHITKRVVARATLIKINNLVSKWQNEDEQDKRLLKRFPLLFVLFVLFFFVLIPYFYRALNSHPKIQLLAISIPIGLLAAIVLIFVNKHFDKKK